MLRRTAQVTLRGAEHLLGVHHLHLGRLVEGLEAADVGDGPRPTLVHPPRPVEEDAESLAGRLGEADRLPGPQDVGVGRVEVVDLEADGVLVLGLQHALRLDRDERPRLPLVGHDRAGR